MKVSILLPSLMLNVMVFLLNTNTIAQNAGINFNGAAPNAAAAFDIDVNALAGMKKGLLIPRVTLAQRTAMNPLPDVAQGLLVYQTDGQQGFYYNSSLTTTPAWTTLVNNLAMRWNVLQNPAANLALDHGTNRTEFTFNGITTTPAFSMASNSITSGMLLSLTSNSNNGTGAGGISKMLNVYRSGLNANDGHIATGIYVTINNTGVNSTNYGGHFLATGAASNYGVWAETDGFNSEAVRGVNKAMGNGSHVAIKGSKTGIGTGGVELSEGFGVLGEASGTAQSNFGGYFYSQDANANYGVFGSVTNGYGAYGRSTTGTGVTGETGSGAGVYGFKFENSGAQDGYGVQGKAIGGANNNYGGHFVAHDAIKNFGVFAQAYGPASQAVHAENLSTTQGDQYGLYGAKLGNTITGNGIAVYGKAAGTATVNYGGLFESSGAATNVGVSTTIGTGNGYALLASNQSNGDGEQYAVYAQKYGNLGSGYGYGVRGAATGTADYNVGGYFYASGAANNYAIYVPANGGKIGLGTNTVSPNTILGMKDGHIQSQQTNIPLISVLAAAGVGATGQIGTKSSDNAGSLQIVNGSSGWAANGQVTVTFNKAFVNTPRVVLTATNAGGAARNVFVTSSATSFTVNYLTAVSSGVSSTFNYMVMEN